MMMIYPQIEDETNWGPRTEDVEDVEAMMKYNRELSEAGVLLALDGLDAPSEGSRVTFDSDGNATVMDGPFTEAKEMVGGYWMIQARSKEEALEWVKRIPGRNFVCELRRVQEREDFPPEIQQMLDEHVTLGEHAGG
jgi:hypothetical protein